MNTVQEKLMKFVQTVDWHHVTVVCRNCGSANLDQNSTMELQCYDCHQTAYWCGKSFGIVRMAHKMTDAETALRNR